MAGWDDYGVWTSADSLRLNPYLKPEGSTDACGILSGIQAALNDKYKMNKNDDIVTIDYLSPLGTILGYCSALRSAVYQLLTNQYFVDHTQSVDGGFLGFEQFPMLTYSRATEIIGEEMLSPPSTLEEILAWAFQMKQFLDLMKWKIGDVNIANFSSDMRHVDTFYYTSQAQSYWDASEWVSTSGTSWFKSPCCMSKYPIDGIQGSTMYRVRGTMDIEINNIAIEKNVILYAKPTGENPEIFENLNSFNLINISGYSEGDFSYHYSVGYIDTIPERNPNFSEENRDYSWELYQLGYSNQQAIYALLKFDGPNGAEFRGPDWD